MHKIVSHEYFLDKMTVPELYIATKYLDCAEVMQWDQTRHIMLTTAGPYLKRPQTPQEYFPLPIDEKEEKLTKEIKQEDVDWFNAYVDNYNNKGEQ